MDQTIRLDAKKREGSFCKERIYPLRRGERNNVTLTVAVRRDRRPYDLAGMTAHLVWQAADGKLVGPVPMEVTDQAAGTVSCTLPDACYSAVGTARAYIELRRGAELVDTTDELSIEVLDCIDADGEQAEEYKPLIAEVREATDAAIKAAAKAVSDTQAAIADVKATEAKLYPVAENILVGSETGAVAHVDDAFAGASMRKITVEGACNQDGTPSPDNPVPIEVIENPVVQVCGKNLLYIGPELKPSDCDKRFDKEIKRIIKPGEYVAGLTPSNYYQDITHDVTLTDGGVQYRSDAEGYGVGVGVSLVPGVRYRRGGVYNGVSASIMFYAADGTFISFNSDEVFTVPENTFYCVAMHSPSVKNATVSVENAWYGTLSTAEYTPHIGTSLAFTLPAEHPYLAKLPDGTADEIRVDRDGNVELVARVARVLPSKQKLSFVQGDEHSASYVSFNIANDSASKLRVMSNAYETIIWTAASGYIYCPQTSNVVIRDNRFTSEAQAIELLNGVVVYIAVEPTRYSLGKIEMPKAQDSIVNAWTDAEVTPSTGIWYVRDVNIVVANLEAAIASITEG